MFEDQWQIAEREKREIVIEYAVCGLCGQKEPVDRNGEFLVPCPRARQ